MSTADALPTLDTIAADARRAADPDFALQKATGRALTRLFAAIVVVQVLGVALWLALVFSGVVDASMNLDGFMISQLLIFLSTIAIGIFVLVRHLKKLRRQAESMSPQPLVDVAPHIDPQARATADSLRGHVQDQPYEWRQSGDPPHWRLQLGDCDAPLQWLLARTDLSQLPLATDHLQPAGDPDLPAQWSLYVAADAPDSPSELRALLDGTDDSLDWIGAGPQGVSLGTLTDPPFPTDDGAEDLQADDLRAAVDRLQQALIWGTLALSR